MKDLERIVELIESEIRPLTSKQDISPSELENLGEAVDILKDVETIKAMRNAEKDGYSFGVSYDGHVTTNPSTSHRYPYMRSYDEPHTISHDGHSMGEHSMGEHSMTSYDMTSYGGRKGMDGDSDGRYSERRGRDAMGRYTSRDYSGHSERQYMIDRLEDMADDARTERERQIIERCIAKLER